MFLLLVAQNEKIKAGIIAYTSHPSTSEDEADVSEFVTILVYLESPCLKIETWDWKKLKQKNRGRKRRGRKDQ